MIPVKEEEDKAILSEEDREMEEEEEEEEEAEAQESEDGSTRDDDDDDDDDDGDVGPEDASDGDEDKNAEDCPQTSDATKKDAPVEKKPPGGLNVNNEVVKMRKEVKRVRALIIRKLTRQIGKLKKKKGKEADVERNQRRAGRLLEEIHAMKVLTPDKVTKTALQKNLNFEQECKNPKSTVADRAIARIATHPQFSKKIRDIKAAVAVFKDERKRGGREKQQSKAGKVTVEPEKKRESRSVSEKEVVAEEREASDIEEGGSEFRSSVDLHSTEANTEPRTVIESAEKTAGKNGNKGEMPQVRAAVAKNTEVKVVRNESKMKEKPKVRAESEEESDLDSSGDEEEKEYFDDSTEERFHKQSSHSEESDDDDFFVGKVSKFKKKKQKEAEAATTTANGVNVEREQSGREKVTSLDSIFCSSLARSKPGRGRGAAGRGRGGDRGRGRGRGESRGVDGGFGKRSKFQERPSGGARGKGRGGAGGGGARRNDGRDGAVFPAEAALHPSWEASKKRKEQQGQILAFQGKKIKFDDDD